MSLLFTSAKNLSYVRFLSRKCLKCSMLSNNEKLIKYFLVELKIFG